MVPPGAGVKVVDETRTTNEPRFSHVITRLATQSVRTGRNATCCHERRRTECREARIRKRRKRKKDRKKNSFHICL